MTLGYDGMNFKKLKINSRKETWRNGGLGVVADGDSRQHSARKSIGIAVGMGGAGRFLQKERADGIVITDRKSDAR